mgnify:CR=1 FL=1
MYRSRLKVKTLILLCMTGVLMILALRRDPDRKGETGEELLISEEEGGEEPEEAVGQEKIWTSPGRDAKIRVLLLDQDGSIYHKEKDAVEGYPGELDYYEEPQGWVIVNELPLEEYLRFVVPSEMPASYALEALKAQAVCARTYAVWQMQEYAYPEYEAHVDDSTSYQVYHKIDSQTSTDQAVEETAESFRDFARSQGHPLELAIVPGLTYCGDEYAVRQLVSILLDNAVKYALPETPIRFVLEKGKRGVVLRCSNACTPLAEGETEKLFDRFYRSDQARSADGSFGVGLSIARSIAEGHHGFIRAQCPQPGEIVFTAQLR